MNGVVISGGNEPSKELLEKVIDKDTIIVFSDSGANVGFKYNLNCNCIVGDLDSISEKAKEHYIKEQCKFVTFSKEKDFTDTELAIQQLLKYNVNSIILLGCIGTRMDHTLANIGLLVDYAENSYDIKIVDEHNEISVLKKSTVIYGEKYKTFSVQAFRGKVSNLNIRGAKYELKDYELLPGDPLTVSNEFLNESVEISFEKGILLFIYPID